MKNLLYMLISTFLFVQCNFVDESKKIETITTDIGKANNSKITFENILSDHQKELALTILMPKNSELAYGKILLDVFTRLQKAGIMHDRYRIMDSLGKVCFDLKASEIRAIIVKKKVYDADLSLLFNAA